MSFSMRMGMGLGAMQVMASASEPPASVWTIDAAADGTKYVVMQCADTGQILTATGGAEIMLGSDGEWGTSVEIPAGAVNRGIYFRGNGVGGSLIFPAPDNVTLLYVGGTGTTITGSINGMALTYFRLNGTSTAITGVPPAIGKTLSSLRIDGGLSYDYPWTEQTFDSAAKRTWTATTMLINCLAAAPTPAQFNTWLLGLASVSNAGDATLTLRNTPTVNALNAEGCGETDTDSGYYAMVTTLGYTLSLGT